MLRGLFPTYYKIKIVVLISGCNIHKRIKPKSLPVTETIGKKEYKVNTADLWKGKRMPLLRILDFFMGVKGHYLCIFRETDDKSKAIRSLDTKATPILIRNVKKSRILGKALSEIFKEGFGGFSRFLIIMLILVILLYFAYQQGLIG